MSKKKKHYKKHTKKDMVNHPDHYNHSKIETIDHIEDMLGENYFIGHLCGTTLKYLGRWPYKNGLEDLKKARWYLNRLIEYIESKSK